MKEMMRKMNAASAGRSVATILGIAGGLVAIGLAGRILPHPPNFTPVAAIAIFAGFVLRGDGLAGRLAWLVPLAVLILGDLVLGLYHPGVMAAVYLAMLLPVLFGRAMGVRGVSLFGIGASALGAAVLFFAISNFAVWLFYNTYPHTLAGLWMCYVAALPFFKYTLAGNVVWLAVLFGGHALLTRVWREKSAKSTRSAAVKGA